MPVKWWRDIQPEPVAPASLKQRPWYVRDETPIGASVSVRSLLTTRNDLRGQRAAAVLLVNDLLANRDAMAARGDLAAVTRYTHRAIIAQQEVCSLNIRIALVDDDLLQMGVEPSILHR